MQSIGGLSFACAEGSRHFAHKQPEEKSGNRWAHTRGNRMTSPHGVKTKTPWPRRSSVMQSTNSRGVRAPKNSPCHLRIDASQFTRRSITCWSSTIPLIFTYTNLSNHPLPIRVIYANWPVISTTLLLSPVVCHKAWIHTKVLMQVYLCRWQAVRQPLVHLHCLHQKQKHKGVCWWWSQGRWTRP